jgi:hypothetical protein
MGLGQPSGVKFLFKKDIEEEEEIERSEKQTYQNKKFSDIIPMEMESDNSLFAATNMAMDYVQRGGSEVFTNKTSSLLSSDKKSGMEEVYSSESCGSFSSLNGGSAQGYNSGCGVMTDFQMQNDFDQPLAERKSSLCDRALPSNNMKDYGNDQMDGGHIKFTFQRADSETIISTGAQPKLLKKTSEKKKWMRRI